jgi:hypothetical protein
MIRESCQPRGKLTGIGKAKGETNEKLVGSLMFLKKGHLRIESSLISLAKKSILLLQM